MGSFVKQNEKEKYRLCSQCSLQSIHLTKSFINMSELSSVLLFRHYVEALYMVLDLCIDASNCYERWYPLKHVEDRSYAIYLYRNRLVYSSITWTTSDTFSSCWFQDPLLASCVRVDRVSQSTMYVSGWYVSLRSISNYAWFLKAFSWQHQHYFVHFC